MLPKAQMQRVVKTTEGGYEIDPTGKQAGRGAYVCVLPECVAKALKNRGFERSYKSGFPKEIYSALAREVSGSDV